MKKRNYLWLAVWGAGSLSASQMDSKSVLSFAVSDKGLTRISIENDSIKDMFAFPASENIKLHPSGHLFVAPSELKEPLYLTVISSDGTTQDLKLTFTDKAPKPVVLKMKETDKRQFLRWLDASLAGAIPAGFRFDPIDPEPRYTENAVAKKMSGYTDGIYSLTIWSVENLRDKEISLQAENFSDRDELGKIQDDRLAPLGTTRLAIITKKKGLKS